MKPTARDILLQILNIIGYEDDKEKFVNGMLQVSHDEAIVALLQKLPLDKRESLKKAFSQNPSPEKAKEIIEQYAPFEQYKKSLQEANDKLFQDYIKAISPTLSFIQKQRLQEYLSSVSQNLLTPQ